MKRRNTTFALIGAILSLLIGCEEFVPPVYFAVLYDGNGSDGGTIPTDTSPYAEEQIVTVLYNSGSLARADFVFLGWTTASDGSGVTLLPGETLIMGTTDVTLYAVWEPIQAYSVTYISVGADGGTPPVDETEYLPGESATVLGRGTLIRNNSFFREWNILADGGGAAYRPGALLDFSDAEATLYSQWTEIEYPALWYESNASLAPVTHSSSAFADFDGDGDLDIISTGLGTGTTIHASLYLNDGNGVFSDASAGLAPVFYSSVSVSDVDGDGDLDLLITGNANVDPPALLTATLYLNDGSGGFTDSGVSLIGVNEGSSDFADVDGDGDDDLVVTGTSLSGATATLYLNNGGDFASSAAGLTGTSQGSSDFADVDGDGDADLLITGNDPIRSTTLYFNDGSGGFTDAAAGLTAVSGSASDFADVDGDGDLDLLIAGSGPGGFATTTLYVNNGSGVFSDAAAGFTDVFGGSITFADVEGDGDYDVLVSGTTNGSLYETTLYLNDGEGNFIDSGAGFDGTISGSSNIGDLNTDGVPDVLITGSPQGTTDPGAWLYVTGVE